MVFVVERSVHIDGAKAGLLAVYLQTSLQTYSFMSGQCRYRKYLNTIANITVLNVIISTTTRLISLFGENSHGFVFLLYLYNKFQKN